MELVEMRESGLLELYVAGELSGRKIALVEEHLDKLPELRADLISIGNAFEYYAKLHKIPVSEGFKEKVLERLRNGRTVINPVAPIKKSSARLRVAASMLFIISAMSLYKYSQLNKRLAALEKERELQWQTQAQLLKQKQKEIAKFKALHTEESKVLTISATDKYVSSEVIMYLDETSKKNYIELKSIPSITSKQSFQLWSLKADKAPVPLDVFQGDEKILEVAFEEGTETYAITIEPFGGQESPNLDNLIGTISVKL